MNKWIKRSLLGILSLFLIGVLAIGVFLYKVKIGFPIYEKTPPTLALEKEAYTVLVFSKTNAFPHTSAIEASKKVFQQFGEKNNWHIVISDNGAVFNDEQLPYFDVVIGNNMTGKNLTDTQRRSFQKYMDNGGGFVGIHGAGDGSHRWPWYEKNLIGANFSHHPLNPQFQEATMHKECSGAFLNCDKLPTEWIREDEWYVFFDNPRDNDVTVLYTVDEATFEPNGALPILAPDKNFGMGDDHPIVWYKCLANGGRTFYSALGHAGRHYEEDHHLLLLESAIRWAGDKTIPCG